MHLHFCETGAQALVEDAEHLGGLQQVHRLPDPTAGDDLRRRSDLASANEVGESGFGRAEQVGRSAGSDRVLQGNVGGTISTPTIRFGITLARRRGASVPLRKRGGLPNCSCSSSS